MYTVGLINQTDYTDCLELYSYASFEEAQKAFKFYKRAFLNNNVVNSNTTIIEKDEHNKVVTIKTIFNCSKRDKYIIFLGESKN